MPRKYKFFIKDKSVIFTDDRSFKGAIKLVEKDWFKAFKSQSLAEDSVVYCKDLAGFVKELRRRFDFIIAGGGYVTNSEGNLLMIHRRGFWDLPKGKLEKGESVEQCAVREVEEETGIGKLSIESKAFFTYHLYSEKGKSVVKESHWFKMKTKQRRNPIAQEEEDIRKAVWVSLPVSEKKYKGAYASIRDVIDHYSGMR